MFQKLLAVLLPVVFCIAAWAAPPDVEIRDWEVFTLQDGVPKQLTDDGRQKAHAILSPSGDRIAYEECPWASDAPCNPSIVIMSSDGGQRISSEPFCPGSLSWISDSTLSLECSVKPWLAEYYQIDTATEQAKLHLYGNEFVLSPDSLNIGHKGGVDRTAPPWLQSDYLQIGRTTIYPLTDGKAPFEQDFSLAPEGASQAAPDTAGETAFLGLHGFAKGLAWSADSKRIALVDCVSDWYLDDPASVSSTNGKQTQRQCSLVAVAQDGSFSSVPLIGFPYADLSNAGLKWESPSKVALDLEPGTPGRQFEFDIP